jgi:glycosyltransferase involved in cell wall biosynthesis
MRVTFVLAHPNLSGGVRVVAIFAEKLLARGHDVTIVTRRHPKPSVKQQIKSLIKGGGVIPDPNSLPSHLDRTPVRVKMIEECRAIEDADVPDGDVVIATWWETAEWVAALSASKGAKVYFVQHNERVMNGQPVDRVAGTYRLPMRKIAVSKWLIEMLADEFGDRDAALVPCAIDPKAFYATPRGKQSTPTVGVMYSVDRFKGCDISLRAFEIARKSLPSLRLMSFGSSAIAPELPLPVGATFEMRPSQERIREIYGSCDGWLFGSRSEGFGLPILEAMGCRTPVIATPAGAAPELLAKGGGILVNPEDSEGMAAAIVRLCSTSDNDWRAMSDNAQATVASYTWDDATDLFEAALIASRGTGL